MRSPLRIDSNGKLQSSPAVVPAGVVNAAGIKAMLKTLTEYTTMKDSMLREMQEEKDEVSTAH